VARALDREGREPRENRSPPRAERTRATAVLTADEVASPMARRTFDVHDPSRGPASGSGPVRAPHRAFVRDDRRVGAPARSGRAGALPRARDRGPHPARRPPPIHERVLRGPPEARQAFPARAPQPSDRLPEAPSSVGTPSPPRSA